MSKNGNSRLFIKVKDSEYWKKFNKIDLKKYNSIYGTNTLLSNSRSKDKTELEFDEFDLKSNLLPIFIDEVIEKIGKENCFILADTGISKCYNYYIRLNKIIQNKEVYDHDYFPNLSNIKEWLHFIADLKLTQSDYKFLARFEGESVKFAKNEYEKIKAAKEKKYCYICVSDPEKPARSYWYKYNGEQSDIRIGDEVIVDLKGRKITASVVLNELFTEKNVPVPLDKTKEIIKLLKKVPKKRNKNDEIKVNRIADDVFKIDENMSDYKTVHRLYCQAESKEAFDKIYNLLKENTKLDLKRDEKKYLIYSCTLFQDEINIRLYDLQYEMRDFDDIVLVTDTWIAVPYSENYVSQEGEAFYFLDEVDNDIYSWDCCEYDTTSRVKKNIQLNLSDVKRFIKKYFRKNKDNIKLI